MTQPHRQRYGLGSFIKKAARKVKKVAKKVWKSPLGKAALIGGGLYGLNKFGIGSSGIGKNWWSKAMGTGPGGGFYLEAVLGSPSQQRCRVLEHKDGGGLWNWIKGNKGKAALLGLGAAGMAAPFMAGDEDDEVIDDWSVTPSSISKIRQMAKDQRSKFSFSTGGRICYVRILWIKGRWNRWNGKWRWSWKCSSRTNVKNGISKVS